jgi:hypothetical protein
VRVSAAASGCVCFFLCLRVSVRLFVSIYVGLSRRAQRQGAGGGEGGGCWEEGGISKLPALPLGDIRKWV